MHADPIAPILIALAVILLGAKLGGALFERLGQPAVLGELLAGVLIGNLHAATGLDVFESLRAGPTHELLDIFARLGAVVLLFAVGLETSVKDMLRVGLSSMLVAASGVIAPWALGFAVSSLLLPQVSFQAHLFIGAILTATSVGITARVFRDLGRVESPEARIVLGAAVIDDVLGLIALAVVSGMVVHGAVGAGDIARVVASSALFVVGSIALGTRAAPLLARALSRVRIRGMKLVTALSFCFGLSWLASVVGLAPIVGAFAAGLVLEEAFFKRFSGEKELHDLLDPFSTFFVPIFFVLMGMDVHLEALMNPAILGLAAGITLAAIIGKQVCGLAVLERGVDRLSIGIGMVPRGEVGLIFASIGRGLGVVDDALYAACVIMVMVTTFAAPPLLALTMKRHRKRAITASRA